MYTIIVMGPNSKHRENPDDIWIQRSVLDYSDYLFSNQIAVPDVSTGIIRCGPTPHPQHSPVAHRREVRTPVETKSGRSGRFLTRSSHKSRSARHNASCHRPPDAEFRPGGSSR